MDIQNYTLRHIASHLYDAGEFERLHILLANEKYFVTCQRNVELANVYRQVIDLGWKAAISEGEKSVDKQYRYLLLLISLQDRATRITTDIWEALVKYSVWSSEKAYVMANMLPEPQKTEVMASLGIFLDMGHEKVSCVDYVLDSTLSFTQQNPKYEWYRPFLGACSSLEAKLKVCDSIHTIQSQPRHIDSRADHYIGQALELVLPALCTVIPDAERESAFNNALNIAERELYADGLIDAYCRLTVTTRIQTNKEYLLRVAIDSVANLSNDEAKTDCLLEIINKVDIYPKLMYDLLEKISVVEKQRFRGRVLEALVGKVYLIPDLFNELWKNARKLFDPLTKAEVLSALTRFVPAQDQQRIMYQLTSTIRNIPDPRVWTHLFMGTIEALPEGDLRNTAFDVLLKTNIPLYKIACRSKREDFLLLSLEEITLPTTGLLKGLDEAWEEILPIFHKHPSVWEKIDRFLSLLNDDSVIEKYVQAALKSNLRWLDQEIEILEIKATLIHIQFELLVLAARYALAEKKSHYILLTHQIFNSLTMLLQKSDIIFSHVSIYGPKTIEKYIELISLKELDSVINFVFHPRYIGSRQVIALARKAYAEGWTEALEKIFYSTIDNENREFFKSTMIGILPILSSDQQKRILQEFESRYLSIGDASYFLEMAATCALNYGKQLPNIYGFIEMCHYIRGRLGEEDYIEAILTIMPFVNNQHNLADEILSSLILMINKPKMRTVEGHTADAFNAQEALEKLLPFVSENIFLEHLHQVETRILVLSLENLPNTLFSDAIRELLKRDAKTDEKITDSSLTKSILRASSLNNIRLDALRLAINEIHSLDLSVYSALVYWLLKRWYSSNNVKTLFDILYKFKDGNSLNLPDRAEIELSHSLLSTGNIEEIFLNISSYLSFEQQQYVFNEIWKLLDDQNTAQARLKLLIQLIHIIPEEHKQIYIERFQYEFVELLKSNTYSSPIHDYWYSFQYADGPSASTSDLISQLGPIIDTIPAIWEFSFKKISEKVASSKSEPASILLLALAQSTSIESRKLCVIQFLIKNASHLYDIKYLSMTLSFLKDQELRMQIAEEVILLLKKQLKEHNESENDSKIDQLVVKAIPLDLILSLPENLKLWYAEQIILQERISTVYFRRGNIATIIKKWAKDPSLVAMLIMASSLATGEEKDWSHKRSINQNIYQAYQAIAELWTSQEKHFAFELFCKHLPDFNQHPRWYILDVCAGLFAPLLRYLGNDDVLIEVANTLVALHRWLP